MSAVGQRRTEHRASRDPRAPDLRERRSGEPYGPLTDSQVPGDASWPHSLRCGLSRAITSVSRPCKVALRSFRSSLTFVACFTRHLRSANCVPRPQHACGLLRTRRWRSFLSGLARSFNGPDALLLPSREEPCALVENLVVASNHSDVVGLVDVHRVEVVNVEHLVNGVLKT